MYNICSGAKRWQTLNFLCDGNSNGCIFPASAYTCQNSELKSVTFKIQVKVIDYNIRITPLDGDYQPA